MLSALVRWRGLAAHPTWNLNPRDEQLRMHAARHLGCVCDLEERGQSLDEIDPSLLDGGSLAGHIQ